MPFVIIVLYSALAFALDAAKDGPIYGDPEGLARVEALEQELHNMKVREDHPRIFITQETLPIYQQRVRNGHPAWAKVKQRADSGDVVNAAFAYLMLKDDDPQKAQQYAEIAIQKLKEMNPQPWSSTTDMNERRKTALMALAFDWVYNVMTQEEKEQLAKKIGDLADISGRAKWIREGNTERGETFHREEWIFRSWRAWPEIALAHHYPDAEFCYKSRWNYDWYWGDAARMYAYAADGTPFEGYYLGANGIGWFYTLKTATGINLVDDPRWPWAKNAAYYLLYRLDFGIGREIFHHGVALGAGGCESYTEGPAAWKIKSFMGETFPLAARDDPYCQWVVNNITGVSSWILSNDYYTFVPGLDAIASILYYDPQAPERDPRNASYQELPYARLFPGGNEVFMLTGWSGDDTKVAFRTTPAYTKTSHGDFDVNTFLLYRKGVLSPDSGIYDCYGGQGNYISYQKNTVAHNDILIIDPSAPDSPRKLSGTPDPGGTERVSTRDFSSPNRFGENSVFVHNPKANWGDIIAFNTTPEYDYVVGEAAKAYGYRLREYYRSLVFLRKGTKAYLIVFDRVESTNPNYEKRWLMHFVTEPHVNGNKISEEVPGHIDTYDGDLTYAENVYGTASVNVKTLLPKQHRIRRIGGEGYEFYVEGTNPKNHPVVQSELERVQSQMGGPWQEAGTWRIEISPTIKQTRDYFLNVMYIGDAGETMPPVKLVEEGNWVGVIINDAGLSKNKILFTKTGTPDVSVSTSNEPPDDIPPGPIQDLAVTDYSDCTVTLSWTAPGDDNQQGTATSYDIRYSTQPITQSNWSQATRVLNPPSPQPAGTKETFTITQLNPSTTYYIAIRAQDDWMNQGPISNLVQVTTKEPIPDTQPPTKPTNLTATAQSTDSILLSWSPSTDNKKMGGYKIYRDGTEIATTTNTSYTDTGLQPSTTYTYRVSAYDASGNESQKSDPVSATTKNETIPPVISQIQVSNITNSSVTITWVTDEPSTSQVRYGETTNYDHTTNLDADLVTEHSVTITGLSSDTTYHFLVISKDRWDNQAVSQDQTFTTLLLPGQQVLIFQEGVSGQPYDNCQDAFIASGASSWQTGTIFNKIQAGITRTLISFPDIIGNNPGQIPPGSRILSASLDLKTYYKGSANPLRAYKLLKPWSEDNVCWDRYQPDHSWDTPGADGLGTDREATPLGDPVIPSSSYTVYTFDITKAVQDWANGKPNYGIIIIQEGAPDEVVFYHSEYGDPSVRPKLRVSFIANQQSNLGKPGKPQHVDD